MSIRLDLADTITFERPLTRVVKKIIRIENPNSQPVAFKVKTTAPRLYCVRPNSEIIPANESMEVQIMLQAFREEPAADVRCKDKFLILSTFALENKSLQDLWAHVETNDRRSIHQLKLRCAYGEPIMENEVNQKVTTTAEATPEVASTAADTIVSQQETEDMNEKMRKMEEELNKYKKQVEDMREVDNVVVVEKTIKKQNTPYGIMIFLALLIAAIAYFIKV